MSILDSYRRVAAHKTRQYMMRMFLNERHGIPVALVGHGAVEWISQEGVSELGKVWVNHASKNMRYIVMKEHQSYSLYDFDSARINKEVGRVELNDPEVFPTEEAAVMAAMLQS